MMMYDMSYNFYEVVEAAEEYFKDKPKGKGSGWKGYQRWKNENESKYYPTGIRSNIDHYLPQRTYSTLKEEYNRYHFKTSFDNGWVELGPWETGTITRHYSSGLGRVETFYVDPADSNRIFLGSRSGGFWKTDDGGSTWTNTTDFLEASGVETIAVNPNNTDEVLISVQHGGNGYTYGIYRSTDGGETWSKTNFEPTNLNWGGLGDNERIYKMAYHPLIENRIYVGTTKGLFVSDDNLDTWTNTMGSWIRDIEFHPTSSNVVYVYRYTSGDANRVKISTDTGYTFVNSISLTDNNNARAFLSTTPVEPDHLYFASTNGVWKSRDRGTTFEFLANPEESCQAFAISDLDTAIMMYGYVDMEFSDNGGLSFEQITNWYAPVPHDQYIHADLRAMECLNGVFYAGTDGYLVKSYNNGETWHRLNEGTAIREFYAAGLSQSNHKVHMAGSQDNGTSILNNDGWIEWNGGDGMEAIIQPLNEDIMLGSWQYGSRNFTNDGGITRRAVGNPSSGQGKAAWEAPLLMNPLKQMEVYHFSDKMYTSEDFGQTWRLTGSPQIGLITEAAIAENNGDIIAVSRGGNLQLTTDGGANWTNRSGLLPGNTITDIAFDPNDDNTMYVTYNFYGDDGKKIYVTYNQGQTWENITYNLGNMPLRTVVVDHSDSSYIYVGGEVGVYYKSKNGKTWTLYDENMPTVTVKDLEIHYGSNSIKAVTWGRGLWEYTLVGRNDYPSINTTNITHPVDEENPKYSTSQFVTASIIYDDNLTNVYTIWSLNNTNLSDTIPMNYIGSDEWITRSAFPNLQEGDNVYFKVIAEGTGNEVSESYRFQFEVKEFEYCFALGSTNTTSDYITRVQLEDIDNESNQDFYASNILQETDLVSGEEYELTITMNYSFTEDTVAAWIDFNNDANFSTDEHIIMSAIDEQHVSTGKFTVPLDAVSNTKLRMRTRSQYNSLPNPCDEFAGEVEDYTVIVRESGNTHELNKEIKFDLSPNPSSGSFEIALFEDYDEVSINVYDLQGKLVHQSAYNHQLKIGLDLNLSSGTYIVDIKADHAQGQKKLIVN